MHNPTVSIIVAMDEKQGIGKENAIPWNIPGEQKRFKEITTPHPMIMGRKTFESIGKILPGRPHIIITRDKTYWINGVTVCHSLEEALKIAQSLDREEIFIIGGGQIWKEALEKNIVDRLYLTIIRGDYGADTFFPEYTGLNFHLVKEEKKEAKGYQYRLLVLEK